MKQYTIIIIITIFLSALIVSCAVGPQLSPAQKRELTTRTYEANYETTYRSILAILQDQGYIVKNTDMETGLINATVDREAATGSQVAQAVLLGYVANKGSELDASFMVSNISDANTEVRLNIQEAQYGQSSRWSGSSKQNVNQILEPEVYNQIFSQILTEISRRNAMNR